MLSRLNQLLLAYSLLPSLGAVRLKKLLSNVGDTDSPDSLALQQSLSLSHFQMIQSFLNSHGPLFDQVTALAVVMQKSAMHMCSYLDACYPYLLRQITDYPVFFFYKGDLSVLSMPQIAIVGSRKASQSSLRTAYSLANQLAEQGLVITSGLAYGIDTAAHSGALACQGRTIAVMGAGLDSIYPRQHLAIANQMLERGCWISEYLPGMKPIAANFPRRNRIISGLSQATLVVEARLNSGTLITARMALEQNRDIFAVPGPIEYAGSQGCHLLIKQGAALVENSEDVLCELNLDNYQPPLPASAHALEPVAKEHYFLKFLEYDFLSLDDLCVNSGLSAAQVMTILVELVLQGKVENLADSYKRI